MASIVLKLKKLKFSFSAYFMIIKTVEKKEKIPTEGSVEAIGVEWRFYENDL